MHVTSEEWSAYKRQALEEFDGDVEACQWYIKQKWVVGVVYPAAWGESSFSTRARGILMDLVKAADYDTGAVDLSMEDLERETPHGLRNRIGLALQEVLEAGLAVQMGQGDMWRIPAAPEWLPPKVW